MFIPYWLSSLANWISSTGIQFKYWVRRRSRRKRKGSRPRAIEIARVYNVIEPLEVRQLLTQIINISGTSEADDFLLQMNADGVTLELFNHADVVYSGKMERVAELNILGGSGEDTLTIDLSNGLPASVGNIHFDGTADGGKIILKQEGIAGGFTKVAYSLESEIAGNIAIHGMAISYNNVSSIQDNLNAAHREFEFPGLSKTVTLADHGSHNDGVSSIQSSLGPTVVFNNPSDSMTVSTLAGSGADTIRILDLDDSFAANLDVLGDENDQVDLLADDLQLGLNGLRIIAQTIIVEGGISSTSGEVTLNAGRNIELKEGSRLQTIDGDIRILANLERTSSGNFAGIKGWGTTIETTGTGDITLLGVGSDDLTSRGNLADGHDGVVLKSGSIIRSTSEERDAGNISLSGFGGQGINANKGLVLMDARILSEYGNISLTGKGGGDLSGGFNYGIVAYDTEITSKGTGQFAATINLTGVGGSGTRNNTGVTLIGSSTAATTTGITSVDGAISIWGQGGDEGESVGSMGIMQSNFKIRSTGVGSNAGTITLLGSGGTGRSFNYGVTLSGIRNSDEVASISSVDGNILISGLGGDDTNLGINMTQAVVSSTGAAEIRIDSEGSYLIRNSTQMESLFSDIYISVDRLGKYQISDFIMTDSTFINSGEGDIYLDAHNNIFLTRLVSAHLVTVESIAGSIFDNDDENSDIFAQRTVLKADGTVGTNDNPLELSVDQQSGLESAYISNSVYRKIIGVGDTGFRTTGFWNNVDSGVNHVRSTIDRAATERVSQSTAEWEFDNLLPGTYRVSGHWTEAADRASNVQYRVTGIVGGEMSQIVDQRFFSANIHDAGVGWQDLGFVTVDARGTIKIMLSDKDANGFVIADAMRIEKVNSILTISNVKISEDTETAIVTVSSSHAVGSPFTVDFTTADGTATAGTDYAATSGTLEFSGDTDGETQTIEVQLFDDTDVEMTEWFLINLSHVVSDTNIAVAERQSNVRIMNDDKIVIKEDTGEQQINLKDIEGSVGNSQAVTIEATSSSPNLIQDLQVNYSTENSTGTLTYSSEPNANGELLIILSVTDEHGSQITHQFPIVVNPVNDAPVAVDDIFETTEDTVLTSVNVLDANLTAADSDIEGQSLVVTDVVGGSVGTEFSLPSGALLTLNADGTFRYDPNGKFEYLAVSETAIDSFTYTITDSLGASDTATVFVTVTGVNNIPTVSAAVTSTITEDIASYNLDLLANASDADTSDILNIRNLLLMSGDDAGVTVNENTLDIDPSAYNRLAAGESEIITYSYNVIDGNGGSVSQTATITISGVNDVPTVSAAVSSTVTEDVVSFNLDLLTNGRDADTSDTLRIRNLLLTGGNDAGITVNGNTLDIDPNAYNYLDWGESEVITYSYNVIDGSGGSVAQTATITITGVNDAPVAVADSFTTDEDTILTTGNVLSANPTMDDNDAEGQSLTVTAVAGGTIGTQFTLSSGALLTLNSNGTFDYDPNGQFEYLAESETAIDSFKYTITDSKGATDTATVTVTITGVNNVPTVSATVTSTVTEDIAGYNLDLLTDTSDTDTSDTLNISDLVLTSGDASGITVNGNTLDIDPSAYNNLAVGEPEVITYKYNVIDGNGGSTAQTATITINGVNDLPTVSATVSSTATEDVAAFNLNLLTNTSDMDASDVLNISGLTLTGGDDAGVTVNGNTLDIDPSAYNHLNRGESEVIIYSYNVIDGNGGSIAQTATITITGVNDAPTVSAAVSSTVNEDVASFNLNLLTNASDTDTSDTLNISDLLLTSGDASGITVHENTLDIDPSAYNSLAAGESEVITYTYNVIDGNGGSVAQTATITINGVNDAPTVGATVTSTVTEDIPGYNLNLLASADDADTNDTLSISNLLLTGGDDAGITVNENTLDIDPNAYNDLAAGESEVITYTYNVIDGNGGSVAQTATITINGVNDAPTVSATVTSTVTEDIPGYSLDLLTDTSDADTSNTLSISNLQLTDGDDAGITVNGDTLDIDPSAYNSLAAGESEVITYTYNVIDDSGGSVAQTATITITGINDAPVAVDDTFTTDEDTMLTSGNVLDANLTTTDSDVEGQSLVVTNVVGGSVGTGFSLPSGALLTINADGTFRYDPNGQFEYLTAGKSVNDTFEYTIRDTQGKTDTARVTIKVTGVNDAPELTATIFDIPINGTSGSIAAVLHGSDIDSRGDISYHTINEYFEIERDTGIVRLRVLPELPVGSSYQFEVTATDESGAVSAYNLIIPLVDAEPWIGENLQIDQPSRTEIINRLQSQVSVIQGVITKLEERIQREQSDLAISREKQADAEDIFHRYAQQNGDKSLEVIPVVEVQPVRLRPYINVSYQNVPPGLAVRLDGHDYPLPVDENQIVIDNLPYTQQTTLFEIELIRVADGAVLGHLYTVKLSRGGVQKTVGTLRETSFPEQAFVPELPLELRVTAGQVSTADIDFLQAQIDIPAYEASIQWLSATRQSLLSEVEGLLTFISVMQEEIASPAPELDRAVINERLAREASHLADHNVLVLSNRVSDVQQHESDLLELLKQRESAKNTTLDQLQLLTDQLLQSQNLPQTQSTLMLQHGRVGALVVALQNDISNVRAILVSLIDNIDETTSILTDQEFLEMVQQELDLETQHVELLEGEYQSALSTLAAREAARDVEQSQFDAVNSVTESARINSESAQALFEQRREEREATLRRLDELRDYWNREIAPILIRGSINNWDEYQEAMTAYQHANQRYNDSIGASIDARRAYEATLPAYYTALSELNNAQSRVDDQQQVVDSLTGPRSDAIEHLEQVEESVIRLRSLLTALNKESTVLIDLSGKLDEISLQLAVQEQTENDLSHQISMLESGSALDELPALETKRLEAFYAWNEVATELELVRESLQEVERVRAEKNELWRRERSELFRLVQESGLVGGDLWTEQGRLYVESIEDESIVVRFRSDSGSHTISLGSLASVTVDLAASTEFHRVTLPIGLNTLTQLDTENPYGLSYFELTLTDDAGNAIDRTYIDIRQNYQNQQLPWDTILPSLQILAFDGATVLVLFTTPSEAIRVISNPSGILSRADFNLLGGTDFQIAEITVNTDRSGTFGISLMDRDTGYSQASVSVSWNASTRELSAVDESHFWDVESYLDILPLSAEASVIDSIASVFEAENWSQTVSDSITSFQSTVDSVSLSNSSLWQPQHDFLFEHSTYFVDRDVYVGDLIDRNPTWFPEDRNAHIDMLWEQSGRTFSRGHIEDNFIYQQNAIRNDYHEQYNNFWNGVGELLQRAVEGVVSIRNGNSEHPVVSSLNEQLDRTGFPDYLGKPSVTELLQEANRLFHDERGFLTKWQNEDQKLTDRGSPVKKSSVPAKEWDEARVAAFAHNRNSILESARLYGDVQAGQTLEQRLNNYATSHAVEFLKWSGIEKEPDKTAQTQVLNLLNQGDLAFQLFHDPDHGGTALTEEEVVLSEGARRRINRINARVENLIADSSDPRIEAIRKAREAGAVSENVLANVFKVAAQKPDMTGAEIREAISEELDREQVRADETEPEEEEPQEEQPINRPVDYFSTIETANDIGVLGLTQRTFRGFVGNGQRNDYFTFIMGADGVLNVWLKVEDASVNIEIIDSAGDVIADATATPDLPLVKWGRGGLHAGERYYVRVFRRDGNTEYSLTIVDPEPAPNKNVVIDNFYKEMALLAQNAYVDFSGFYGNWVPVELQELGLGGTIHEFETATQQSNVYGPLNQFEDDGTLVYQRGREHGIEYTYSDGIYTGGYGSLGEAGVLLLRGLVNGKTTLVISFRGTDQTGDILDWPDHESHYAKLKPLIDSLKSYVNEFERIYVTGHSLGGSMAQIFLQREFPGDNRFRATTYGSPGTLSEYTNTADARIVNFAHKKDIVIVAGRFLPNDIAKQLFDKSDNLAQIAAYLSKEGWNLLTANAMESQPDALFHVSGQTIWMNSSLPSDGWFKPINWISEHDISEYINSVSDVNNLPPDLSSSTEQLRDEITQLFQLQGSLREAYDEVTKSFENIKKEIHIAEQKIDAVHALSDFYANLGNVVDLENHGFLKNSDIVEGFIFDPIIGALDATDFLSENVSLLFKLNDLAGAYKDAKSTGSILGVYVLAYEVGKLIGDDIIEFTKMRVNQHELNSLYQMTLQMEKLNRAIAVRQIRILELES